MRTVKQKLMASGHAMEHDRDLVAEEQAADALDTVHALLAADVADGMLSEGEATVIRRWLRKQTQAIEHRQTAERQKGGRR